MRTGALRAAAGRMDADDREHVTAWLYRHPDEVRLLRFEHDPPVTAPRLTLDEPADHVRLERDPASGWAARTGTTAGTRSSRCAQRLRAAVIGLGVGEQHLAGYAAHPACEAVAICDVDPARLREVAARHPELRATTDPRRGAGRPGDVDVVSVASYDDAHFAQIRAALRARQARLRGEADRR